MQVQREEIRYLTGISPAAMMPESHTGVIGLSAWSKFLTPISDSSFLLIQILRSRSDVSSDWVPAIHMGKQGMSIRFLDLAVPTPGTLGI